MDKVCRCFIFLCSILLCYLLFRAPVNARDLDTFQSIIQALDGGNQQIDGAGREKTAEFIKSYFKKIGIKDINTYPFFMPEQIHGGSTLFLPDKNVKIPLTPLRYNAVTPQSTPPDGLPGHVIFAGKGRIKDFNGHQVKDAIVLMDIHSGKNWLNAASLGAEAVIFYDSGIYAKTVDINSTKNEFAPGEKWPGRPKLEGAESTTDLTSFEDKTELTPINFPMFWLPKKKLEKALGPLVNLVPGTSQKALVKTNMIWKRQLSENIYAMIPGQSLAGELIIVEAFYDASPVSALSSPGADQLCSLATLLALADHLQKHPPVRSVMLAATAGHDQALAGWRDMMWSLAVKSKELKQSKKALESAVKEAENELACLNACIKKPLSGNHQNLDKKNLSRNSGNLPRGRGNLSRHYDTLFKDHDDNLSQDNDEHLFLEHLVDEKSSIEFQRAIKEPLAMAVDDISQDLMALRLAKNKAAGDSKIKELARKRFMIRKMGWASDYTGLSHGERAILAGLIDIAARGCEHNLKYLEKQLKVVKKAVKFRKSIEEMDIKAVVSLHLSSHGDGFGAFDKGWLYYPLRARINRTSALQGIDSIFKKSAVSWQEHTKKTSQYRDTLKPSRLTPWESWLVDRPALGGEVSALAGYPGLTLATVNDARWAWGTPLDTMDGMDIENASRQSLEISHLIHDLCTAPEIKKKGKIRNGFATVTGRCRLQLHGELFADHPAPDTIIFSFQGPGRYYAMSDVTGTFQIKGVADKKHLLDKVIIEGYRFNESDGSVKWAIDKELTGKPAYRLKMNRRDMETDLILFNARQTTIFNLMEPRNFNYMTKINLLDGRRDAPPLKYWYSRIDTRASILTSIFLEPGTYLKLTLSESILKKKLILTNADEKKYLGRGYRVEDWPAIHNTHYRVANDMWHLITPRVENLEQKGIFNHRINKMEQKGLKLLNTAEKSLKNLKYDRFLEASLASWALATRVYEDVERTRKDVLFGVLFYIALFVPFAFCFERLLFGFTSIYRRISAFFIILLLQIAIVYKVHPAFKLAYSPLVIIIAFFIIGLSMLVTLIIFLRFEQEMVLIQRKATQMRQEEISSFKAFIAAFYLGVSNLRRRRVRTALTCTTLVILTFTIMGFTTVKSMRRHARTLLHDTSPRQGFLMKNFNWNDLPPEALPVLENAFTDKEITAPRVWMEAHDRTASLSIPLKNLDKTFNASGLMGLDPDEPGVSGMDRALIAGRWFLPGETDAVLLPDNIAEALDIHITPENPAEKVTGKIRNKNPSSPGNQVIIWGKIFQVVGIFDHGAFMERKDLDGEPMTPVTFPSEMSMEVTEVEMEAMEAGEDIFSFQSRYSHVPPEQTIIMPAKQLLAAGGRLKALAVRSVQTNSSIQTLAEELVDRFALMLFSGEPGGTFVYNVSNTMNYSGVPNILIPILISIFIVLNTMISSVYERKKEIGIYTSVGLAPSHVSFLFIAEAMAFAVISGVTGYLAAQTSATLFAHTSLWEGITVNYSSTAGIAAMVLVMTVVMISAIYPSRVAARIAIPDINRTWKLPLPEGDMLNITLPFLMKAAERESISGFLYNYFDNHQDYSQGAFSTGTLTLMFSYDPNPIEDDLPKVEPEPQKGDPGRQQIVPERQIAEHNEPGRQKAEFERKKDEPDQPEAEKTPYARKPSLHIVSQVWLSPFDFGIMQNIDICFSPSMENAGYLEIHMQIKRESGEMNSWLRINRRFVHEIRRQLLIWRSLNDGAKDSFAGMIRSL